MTELCAIALLAACVVLILRTLGFRAVGVCVAVFSAVILSLVIARIGELKDSLLSFAQSEVLLECIHALSKVMGAVYLFGICEDVCLSLGEAQIAKALEVAGRVEIIAILLPFFESCIALGTEFL